MHDITLILNTAEKRVMFVLSRGGTILCAQDWLAQRGGTELLAPALQSACAGIGEAPSSIRRIACIAGPGNFTGIRIGITTASGLARAVQAKQAGMDYLHCLAINARPRCGEEILVMTNARRNLAYGARFLTDENGIPRSLGRTFLLPLPDIPQGAKLGAPHIIVGSALSSSKELMHKLFPHALLLPSEYDQPSPAALLAMERLIDWEQQDGADIVPLYLRDCDAMDNFDSIAQALGRTPESARQELHRLMNTGISEE